MKIVLLAKLPLGARLARKFFFFLVLIHVDLDSYPLLRPLVLILAATNAYSPNKTLRSTSSPTILVSIPIVGIGLPDLTNSLPTYACTNTTKGPPPVFQIPRKPSHPSTPLAQLSLPTVTILDHHLPIIRCRPVPGSPVLLVAGIPLRGSAMLAVMPGSMEIRSSCAVSMAVRWRSTGATTGRFTAARSTELPVAGMINS